MSERKVSPWVQYPTGAVATMGACVFSNPFEVMKTRLQLQGELKGAATYQRAYRNVFHAMISVYRAEGIRGVQAGLGLGLLYQAAMNGSRLTVYDYLKEKHNEYTGRGLTLPENIAAAAFAGSIGAFFGSPFYLVKTQQQAQTAVEGIGYQHKHTSSLQAFRNIVATEGVFGLWRGVFGSIPRLMVGSAAQLTSYSKSKETIQSLFPHLQEGIAQQFAASMLAGSFVAVCMNPFDVITTRLYNQPVDPVTKRGVYYSGFLDAFVKIARTEGVTGFYKGLSALYFRIGPHTVLTFVFWERLRALVGAKYV